MTKTVTTLQARYLAEAYHDAMCMVNQPDHPYHPSTSPTAVLDRYLNLCNDLGVKMHNDIWEERAVRVVEKLNKRRAAAFRKLMRSS